MFALPWLTAQFVPPPTAASPGHRLPHSGRSACQWPRLHLLMPGSCRRQNQHHFTGQEQAQKFVFVPLEWERLYKLSITVCVMLKINVCLFVCFHYIFKLYIILWPLRSILLLCLSLKMGTSGPEERNQIVCSLLFTVHTSPLFSALFKMQNINYAPINIKR